jgi:hypothetical protein
MLSPFSHKFDFQSFIYFPLAFVSDYLEGPDFFGVRYMGASVGLQVQPFDFHNPNFLQCIRQEIDFSAD